MHRALRLDQIGALVVLAITNVIFRVDRFRHRVC
jgi:hypothetical protein